MGKQCIEELVDVQSELFETLQQTNRHWLERVQSEAALSSRLATKLTATRSVSEAMATCEELASCQIEMIAEDSKLLVADTQRFMETGARLLGTTGGRTALTVCTAYARELDPLTPTKEVCHES